MTSLIEENELHNRLELTVVTTFDGTSRNLTGHIRNTRFIWVPRASSWYKAAFRLVRGIRRRIFHSESQLPGTYYAKALQALKGHDFDAVIMEGGPVDAPTAFIRRFGNRLWYHLHFTPENDFTSRGYSTVLSVSDFASKAWIQHCSGSSPTVITVRNGIDTSKFTKTISSAERNRIRQSLGFSPDDFVIMYCGRIIPVKGVLELLHAVERISDPNIKLLIVGSSNFGPSERTDYTDAVTAAISRLGRRVAATGFVPNDQVYRYSHIADAQVVPSLWEESAGLVGVEGMAAGLPLIVTHSGGLTEYVPQECSIVVERGEHMIASLAKAIMTLYHDAALRDRMAQEGPRHAAMYSTGRMYGRFVDVCRANI
ncbi:glycosyltransferase family 4 protein [Bifidobacterium leontopitheci]|nr:glycosyltransferase family 4 protein [Bifidobacterium leontopitheci]